MVRYHLIFKGRVQGVGFRFTAQNLANKYGILGWVRNNPDGTVELVAEAEKGKLDLFLEELREDFKGYIYESHKKVLPATGEFNSFRIAFF